MHVFLLTVIMISVWQLPIRSKVYWMVPVRWRLRWMVSVNVLVILLLRRLPWFWSAISISILIPILIRLRLFRCLAWWAVLWICLFSLTRPSWVVMLLLTLLVSIRMVCWRMFRLMRLLILRMWDWMIMLSYWQLALVVRHWSIVSM